MTRPALEPQQRIHLRVDGHTHVALGHGLGIGAIWWAHIGMDHAVGFGLKSERGFKITHLTF